MSGLNGALNDTTPAAPSGKVNVKWQTDGYGNISAYYTPSSGAGEGWGQVVTKSASYSAAVGDIVLVTASASGITITVPAASTAVAPNSLLTVKNLAASTNNITVIVTGTDTIDGQTSWILTPGACLTIVSNSSGVWSVI